MKIEIKYLDCGVFGAIIDCDVPRIFCPFCKERNVIFSETKEVTPQELYSLLKYNRNKYMITEDYVGFETAKLLKEKGFQQLQDNCGYFTTEMVYSIDVNDNGEHHFAHQYPAGVYNRDKYIAAPTLQMAMKWLREVHNIHIDICSIWDVAHWIYQVFVITPRTAHNSHVDKILYTSYEQAIEAGIKYCLENLI